MGRGRRGPGGVESTGSARHSNDAPGRAVIIAPNAGLLVFTILADQLTLATAVTYIEVDTFGLWLPLLTLRQRQVFRGL